MVKPSAVVRDLCVLLDAELTMKQNVSNVARTGAVSFSCDVLHGYGVASTTTQPGSWSVVWCCPD